MPSIAIVGAGISGLGAAYLLQPQNDITVYEKQSRIGGHSRCLRVKYGDQQIAVDTGFIVFNYRNYPHLSALFKRLQVPTEKSVMSFAVAAKDGSLEWSAENLNGLFGQRSNLLKPKFYGFLLDVLRFNRLSIKAVKSNAHQTLGEFIDGMRLGDWFKQFYILPMGGAIWSCSLKAMLGFPATMFVDFFAAHGLLTVTQQPQWYTVKGGSDVYIDRLTASFRDRIRVGCGVQRVTRHNGKVQVEDFSGQIREYDHVIFASHADETLAMLEDADANEKEILSKFTYQKNVAVLHRDTAIMPKRRRCWASWVYHAGDLDQNRPIAVTYWMNHLQGIDHNYPLFVTLNAPRQIPDALVFDRHEFMHPVYSPEAVNAQKRLPEIQGRRNSWYCGAYLKNGFHEDGLTSAVAVAGQLHASIPWL